MWQDTGINWTIIINFIVQTYFENFTICLIKNSRIELNLNSNEKTFYALVNIELKSLEKSFENNVENFSKNREKLNENGVIFNDLTEKLLMSIEKTHCEVFIAFDENILPFIESFQNASRYSVWRSKSNHFIFGLSDENEQQLLQATKFLDDHSNILVVILSRNFPYHFDLKTNKFQGPKSEQQNSLLLLDRFYSTNQSFLLNASLFPDKIRNLKGREVILTGFDYRPYMVINYVDENNNNSYDLAYGADPKGSAQIDGTEARVILTFCEIYNCTVLIDSTEADDWGEVLANFSGVGCLGMVGKGSAEISVGAMYSWDIDYIYLDMSMYLVRSGITCLVPAPKRLASWLLPLEPFEFSLWLAVFAYLTIEILSLCLTHGFECSHVRDGKFSWFHSLRFAAVTTIKLFLSQSGHAYVTSWSVRVLLFTCFLNDIIITSIYGGGLASILTIPSYDEAADTLDRMLSRKLTWAANSEAWVASIRYTNDHRIDGILKNFQVYTDEKLKYFAETKTDWGFTVERLPFGHFAIGDYLAPESIDRLKIMQEDLYFQYTVAFVARCWPLLPAFDELVYWWHSAGLDKYWEWRVVADNMNVQKQKQVEATMYSYMEDIGPVKLGMSNFAGILLLWVLGILLAFLVFLYEIIEVGYMKRKWKSLFSK